MVGSCTNSSYEDLDKTRQLLAQAKRAGVDKFKIPFLLTPGSEQVRATAEADGILDELREAGACRAKQLMRSLCWIPGP